MRYLIIKTSALGDILQALPVAEYLKRRDPDCQIDWVVEKRCADAMQLSQFVDRRIIIDTRTRPRRWALDEFDTYDALFDLQGNCKSAYLTFKAKAKAKVGYRFRQTPEWLAALPLTHRFKIDEHRSMPGQYLQLIASYFEDHNTALYRPFYGNAQGPFMVCLGSRWENKRLSFNQWLDFLNRVDHPIILIWGSDEERSLALRLCAKLSNAAPLGGLTLSQWKQTMLTCKGVIAVDSSGLHMASLAGIPTFSIFGPSNSAIYAPAAPNHSSIQGECPYGKQFLKRCPVLRSCKSGACIKDIDPLDLFSAFREWQQQIQ